MKFSKLNCSAKFYSENNDSNLMKVKLMIVHPGRNRNYSSISKETINDAMESVKNIPILGYVKRDDNGDIADFDGHNMETRIVDGDNGFKIETVYLEKPIGVIPESCNPRFEEINGHEYFTVDGYVWKSYSNAAYKLIENSEFKNISMEIKVIDGEYDDIEDVYNITKYRYEGITVLGDCVEPGVKGANMTKYSKCADYKVALEEIYKEIFSLESEVNTMENQVAEVVEEVIEEPFQEVVETEVVEPVEVVETETEVEVPADEIIEEEKAEETETEVVEEPVEVEEPEQNPLEIFKLLFDEIPGSLEEIAVKLNDRFEQMNVELNSLREYKAAKEQVELECKVEDIITEFETLDFNEIEPVKAKVLAGEIDVDTFKKELYCLVGMKALQKKQTYSAKEEVNQVKVMDRQVDIEFDDNYGGLLKKYLM